MAITNEIWICDGVEGTTRRQQMARLGEWKKLFLAEGAKDVKVWEGGYGEFNGVIPNQRVSVQLDWEF